MKKNKGLNIFLLCLGGGFFMLGNKFGILYSVLSSLSFITWAILFIDKSKKTTF
ncbi:MAG: hypothetical protein ACI8WT_002234 [Clostridium sp.]|jgi:hypothetical protein